MKAKLFIICSFFWLLNLEIANSGLTGPGIGPILHARDLFNNTGNYIESHMSEIAWGQQTNGVRVGLMNGNPLNNSLDAKREIVGVFHKNDTTNVLWFVVPPIPSQFDLTVFDEQGFRIARTKKGGDMEAPIPRLKQFTQEQIIHNEWDKQSNAREFLYPTNVELFTAVNLLDYFKITKPGKYRVEYEQRLQTFPDSSVQSTNKLPSLVGLVWPKATITIEVH